MQFVSLEEAKQASGLRLTFVANAPSPWGEAVKGMLKVKNIPLPQRSTILVIRPIKPWSSGRARTVRRPPCMKTKHRGPAGGNPAFARTPPA